MVTGSLDVRLRSPGQTIAAPTEVGIAYDAEALARVVGGEQWNRLTPNLPSPDDLHPRELGVDHIVAVVNAFHNPALIAPRNGQVNEGVAALTYHVPGVGVLERIGPDESSESKICYQLTTETGKKMAVLIAGYDSALGVRAPDDARMSLISRSATRKLWEYSDLRTYLYVPIAEHRAIKFQELGGADLSRMGSSLLVGIARKRAMNRILEDPASKSFIDLDGNTKHELGIPRHYLSKEGYRLPAVIDIPVSQKLR